MKTRHERCAGGLVVKGSSVLLISVEDGQRWQLPKGHIEPGESAQEAGVREVREETGVTGEVVASLPTIEYWFVEERRLRVHKTVRYFLLDYRSGDAADYDPAEVSDARWFLWERALEALTFDNERKLVEAAWDKVRRRHEQAVRIPGLEKPTQSTGNRLRKP